MDAENRQQGPVDASQLKKLKISPSTKVWKCGMKQYVEAASVLPELFSQPQSQPQPQPQPQPQSRPQPQPYPRRRPRKNKIDPNWKTFAIIQLVAVLVFFFPCSLFLEFMVSDSMNSMEYLKEGHDIWQKISSMAWFGAKYWPLVAILVAAIFALSSVVADNTSDLKKRLFWSLGICIGTLVLGIVSIFIPLIVFYVMIAGIVIMMLYTSFVNS